MKLHRKRMPPELIRHSESFHMRAGLAFTCNGDGDVGDGNGGSLRQWPGIDVGIMRVFKFDSMATGQGQGLPAFSPILVDARWIRYDGKVVDHEQGAHS